ncbi:increased DNA methylation 3-like [Populus alba x Populus x berolinensis]|nr:increased DNA methylation 3-like [Populus alba x Populus x berolinensis]
MDVEALRSWWYEGLKLSGDLGGSMDACDSASQPKLKPLVILSGTAKEGSAGPPIGLVDIGVSENAYLFRVALPGIRRNESNLKCDIQHNGTVHIKGVVTVDAGMLKDSSSVFQMRVQQLCPPGPFTISFKLPGPVDPRLFCPNFRNDGVLEVAVMKYRPPSAPTNGVPPL